MKPTSPFPGGQGQRKPEGIPRIDRDHPLAQGLIFYGYDCGNGIIELAKNRQPTSIDFAGNHNYSPISTTAYGRGEQFEGFHSTYFTRDSDISSSFVMPMSWGCAYTRNSTMPDSTGIFGRTANNGGSIPWINWDIEFYKSGISINWCYSAAVSNTGMVLVSDIPTGFNSVLAVASASTVLGYQNGTLQANKANTAFVNYTSGAGKFDNIIFGGVSSSIAVNPFKGMIWYGAVWSRALSAAEAAQLHNDPYCFLVYPDKDLMLTNGALSFSSAPKKKFNKLVRD
jgi:hypothetical protein